MKIRQCFLELRLKMLGMFFETLHILAIGVTKRRSGSMVWSRPRKCGSPPGRPLLSRSRALQYPLLSFLRHLSYDCCLEVKGKILKSVPCCLCTVISTLRRAVLKLQFSRMGKTALIDTENLTNNPPYL